MGHRDEDCIQSSWLNWLMPAQHSTIVTRTMALITAMTVSFDRLDWPPSGSGSASFQSSTPSPYGLGRHERLRGRANACAGHQGQDRDGDEQAENAAAEHDPARLRGGEQESTGDVADDRPRLDPHRERGVRPTERRRGHPAADEGAG